MKIFFTRRNSYLPPALVLLLALILRLLGISSRPIWYDEAFAVLFSEKGLPAMLTGTLTPDVNGAAADIHPLAYYALLGNWMRIFGESLTSVRLLSVLIGLGMVALTYFFLRNIFSDERLAWIGALGVAAAPFVVHYSQEIRMYALLAFSLTAATYAFWHGLHSSNWGWWILFAICAALAQYTQNLAAFYLIPLACTPVLLRRWDKVKMTVLAGAGAILLNLPWLVHLPAQFAKVQNAYWVARPTIGSLFTTLLIFVTDLPVPDGWLTVALVITLLVTALAAYQTWLALRRNVPGARRAAWLAYLAFTPPLLGILFSLWYPVYIERAFLASGVMFWLWLAWALTAARLPRILQTLSLTLLAGGMILGLVAHLTYIGFPYGPYQALDASLESRIQPGDVIIHSSKLTLLPALYFDRILTQHFIADPPGSSIDTLAPATQKVLGVAESATLEAATTGAQRVWFIIFQQSIDEAKAQGLVTHPHITWLEAHFRHETMETWGPIRLYIYTQ